MNTADNSVCKSISSLVKISQNGLAMIEKRNALLRAGDYPGQRSFYGKPVSVNDGSNIAIVHDKERIVLTGDGRDVVTGLFGVATNVLEVFSIGGDTFWFFDGSLARAPLPIGVYGIFGHNICCYDSILPPPAGVQYMGANYSVVFVDAEPYSDHFKNSELASADSYVVSINGEITILNYKNFSVECVLSVSRVNDSILKADTHLGAVFSKDLDVNVGDIVKVDLDVLLIVNKPVEYCLSTSRVASIRDAVIDHPKLDSPPNGATVGVICNHKDYCENARTRFWRNYNCKPCRFVGPSDCYCGLSDRGRYYGDTAFEPPDLTYDKISKLTLPSLFPFEIENFGVGKYLDSFFFNERHLPLFLPDDRVGIYFPWDTGFSWLIKTWKISSHVFYDFSSPLPLDAMIYFDNGDVSRFQKFGEFYRSLTFKPSQVLCFGVFDKDMLEFYKIYHGGLDDVNLSVPFKGRVFGDSVMSTTYDNDFGYVLDVIKMPPGRKINYFVEQVSKSGLDFTVDTTVVDRVKNVTNLPIDKDFALKNQILEILNNKEIGEWVRVAVVRERLPAMTTEGVMKRALAALVREDHIDFRNDHMGAMYRCKILK